MEEIKVRKDLNEIVKSIGFVTIKNTRYGDRHVCNVKLFNDKVIEYRDTENLYDLFQSYTELYGADFIKSKELVEELKTDENGQVVGKYICVKYIIADDEGEHVYRMFASNFNSNTIIDNYYKLYKKNKKTANINK